MAYERLYFIDLSCIFFHILSSPKSGFILQLVASYNQLVAVILPSSTGDNAASYNFDAVFHLMKYSVYYGASLKGFLGYQ